MSKNTILSGIKPSGELTIGNYIGAIKQFVQLQEQFSSYIFIADLHAITVPQDSKLLRERIYEITRIYLASGLDPEKTTLFVQSEVPAHAELGWIMTCNSYMGELERMTQYKDLVLKNKSANKPIGSGILQYPPLMAADILLYNPEYVPVGDDQSQHVELTRTLAERINGITKSAIFNVPKLHKTKAGARIMSLQNPTKKMSKSAENPKEYIALLDDPKVAAKKIKAAVTDSDTQVKYDPENKPGISNLLTIYAVLTDTAITEAENKFANARYGEFKGAVAEVVENFLTDFQIKFYSFDQGMIDKILDAGRDKATAIATKKLHEVYHALGIGRY